MTPKVSILVPCFNEADFIEKCLETILANDYPQDSVEILVIDGMSSDGTREIVARLAEKHPRLRLLDNPKRITSCALNIGLKESHHEIIIWMSAHNQYGSDYVSKCVSCLQKHDADNVGGSIVTLPRKDTLMGRAIVAAISHPFGVGNSYFRTRPHEPKWVDTVFGGCYKRSVFETIGLFNEDLVRGQDLEFNLRLKAAGGKILLAPDIVSQYFARSDLPSFWKHNWTNGIWAVLPFAKSKIVPVSLRHLVPLFFALSIIASAALFFWPPSRFLLPAVLGSYGICNIAASAHAAWKAQRWKLLFSLPIAFGALHFGYGFGSVWGLILVLKNLFSR